MRSASIKLPQGFRRGRLVAGLSLGVTPTTLNAALNSGQRGLAASTTKRGSAAEAKGDAVDRWRVDGTGERGMCIRRGGGQMRVRRQNNNPPSPHQSTFISLCRRKYVGEVA
jgi:hypothetical protein